MSTHDSQLGTGKFVEVSRSYYVKYGYDHVDRTYCHYPSKSLEDAFSYAQKHNGSVYLSVSISDGKKTLVSEDHVQQPVKTE